MVERIQLVQSWEGMSFPDQNRSSSHLHFVSLTLNHQIKLTGRQGLYLAKPSDVVNLDL